MSRSQIWLLAFFVSILIVGCSSKGVYSPSLIVEPGATNVRFGKLKGHDEVSYCMKVKFPDGSVMKDISHKLTRQGYKWLEKDLLNPGMPNVIGWHSGVIERGHPEYNGYIWSAEWTNEKGDIVQYFFRYSWPKEGPEDLDDLKISAMYFPAELVKSLQKEVRDYEKKMKEQGH